MALLLFLWLAIRWLSVSFVGLIVGYRINSRLGVSYEFNRTIKPTTGRVIA